MFSLFKKPKRPESEMAGIELKNTISRTVHEHWLPGDVNVALRMPETGRIYCGNFQIEYFNGRRGGAKITPVDYFGVNAPITADQLLEKYKSDSPLVLRNELALELGERLVRSADGSCLAEVSGRRISIYVPRENLPVFNL